MRSQSSTPLLIYLTLGIALTLECVQASIAAHHHPMAARTVRGPVTNWMSGCEICISERTGTAEGRRGLPVAEDSSEAPILARITEEWGCIRAGRCVRHMAATTVDVEGRRRRHRWATIWAGVGISSNRNSCREVGEAL